MQRDDDLETREEDAAAAEAAGIGGENPDPGVDPAGRPLAEGGGGEAEGFELAEGDLIRNASHDDGRAYPLGDEITPEAETDLADPEFSQADDAQPEDP